MKFLDKLFGAKTTSLEDDIENKSYLVEKLKQAEIKGKQKAKEEAKEKSKQKGSLKGAFGKFQDYASTFSKQQSVFGDMNLTNPCEVKQEIKKPKVKKKHKKIRKERNKTIVLKLNGGNI